MANIYNEPGSTNVKITLKNNIYSYLNTNIGIAKICLITDQKKFGYSDLQGNLKKCLTDASGSSVTPKNCVFIADSEGSASHSTTFVYNDNKLGVNIATPQNRAHFHEPSTGNCLIQITNASRGSSGDNDGMTIGIVGDDNVIRTTYNTPVKIQVEANANPGTFVDLATFQDTGWRSNTILNTDLTVSIIPAKTTAASVFLTHDNNTITTRTAAQVRDDIGAAPAAHTHGAIDLPANIVYTDNAQTITGAKTFSSNTTFGGNIITSKSLMAITPNTSDGADTKGIILGYESTTRGAGVGVYGNESGHGGDLIIQAGTGNGTRAGAIRINSPLMYFGTRPANDYRWTLALDQYNTFYGSGLEGSGMNIMHNLYHDGSSWRYRYGSGSKSGGILTTLAYNQFSVQVADNGTADQIATLTPAIYTNLNGNTAFGKNTLVGGYKVEVEGNTLVNGYTASIYPSNNSVYYRDVYQYSANMSYHTGTMKFTLPKTWANTMLTFTIKGYDCEYGRGAWECIIYKAEDYYFTWYNCTAEIRGFAPFSQVRLAHDGTKCCLLLGDTSTDWVYPQVAITEVFASYGETSGWGEPYTMEIITSESGLDIVDHPRTIIYGNNAVIPNTALIGKTTAVGGNKLEVEGNTLVNGTLKANGVYLDPSKVKAGTSQAGAGAVAGELWRNTSTGALHLGI